MWEFHELSLHGIEGITTRKSLKLWEKIRNKKVIVLIDCGATQNFISVKLVKELRLEVTPTSPYFVEVGDGHKVRCQECVDPCLLNCKIYSSHRIVT